MKPPSNPEKLTKHVFTDFAGYHLHAAQIFARPSIELERKLEQESQGKHRSCVLGAIVSAVSFMEAAINQLFLFPELSLLRDEYFVQHGFTSQTRKMLAELWKSGSPQESVGVAI